MVWSRQKGVWSRQNGVKRSNRQKAEEEEERKKRKRWNKNSPRLWRVNNI